MSLGRRVTGLPGTLAATFLLALACLWGFAQAVTYYRIAWNTVDAREMGDFGVFYASSARVLHGDGDPYEAPRSSPQTPNLNPPHVIAWLVPLARLDAHRALLVWAVAGLLSAIAALTIVFRELRVTPTPGVLAAVLFCALIAAPTGALLFTAQSAWLLWAPLTYAWSAARRGRWTGAAIALGVVMSVKPFLGLFVPMLVVTRRRGPALVASCVALACLLSGLVLGPSTYLSWWNAIRSVTWAGHVFNASAFGLLERLFAGHTEPLLWNLEPIAHAAPMVVPLWVAAAIAIGVISARALPAGRDAPVHHTSPVSVDRLFAITTSASLLMTPLGWIYYEYFLVAPFLALAANPAWRVAVRARGALLCVGVVSLVLTPGLLVLGQPNGWATLAWGSAYFWGLLAFWIGVLPPDEGTVSV